MLEPIHKASMASFPERVLVDQVAVSLPQRSVALLLYRRLGRGLKRKHLSPPAAQSCQCYQASMSHCHQVASPLHIPVQSIQQVTRVHVLATVAPMQARTM